MPQTKLCSKCKIVKPILEFYKDCCSKDGHSSICKTCRKAIANKQYQERHKYWLDYFRKYRQNNKFKVYQRRYWQGNRGKVVAKHYQSSDKGKATIKRYNADNPEKKRARMAVMVAIRTGKLFRPSTLRCKYCPKQAQQYHHPDYSKTIDVEPVCRKCHKGINFLLKSV